MISSSRSASRRLTGFQSTGHHKSAQKARKRAMASYSAACIELSEDNLCEEDDWDHFGDNKKRRLTFEQVKTLEKSFEVGNKLEVERKKQLATTLGLQPKQIAVWFQNRRVRWKTKQLEKDYNALKQAYDALKTNYDTLLQERTQFQDEVHRLNSELGSNCKERSTKSSALIKPTSKSVTEISAKSEMFIKTREACEKDSEDFGSSSIVSEGSSVLNLGNPRTIENPLSPQFTVRDVPCELIRRLLAEQSGYGPKFLPKWEEESVLMNEGEETWCNLFLGCEGQGPTFWDYYSHES